MCLGVWVCALGRGVGDEAGVCLCGCVCVRALCVCVRALCVCMFD
jgi:hypothetical protein